MHRLGADLFRNGQKVSSWCGGRITSHQTGHGLSTPSRPSRPPRRVCTQPSSGSLYVMVCTVYYSGLPTPKLPRSSSSLSLASPSPNTSADTGQHRQGDAQETAWQPSDKDGEGASHARCSSAGQLGAGQRVGTQGRSCCRNSSSRTGSGERHVRQVAGPSLPLPLSLPLYPFRRLRGATEQPLVCRQA